ncbi:MAG: hypothetical protein NT069_03600 [Planctomycetota bacterium]|nr:hypothetical protein [Planctomycetota bacterium]
MFSPFAHAQGGAKGPLVIINAASFERLMSQAVTTFEAAGRPELAETLGGGLARVNDLKGLTRNQSVGVMIYLNGLSPSAVAYVPVKNIGDLLKTVELAPVTTKKISETQYEIMGQRQTIYVRLQGDYAFVSNESAALDGEIPDPVQVTRRLSAQYDLSAAINLKGLDPNTRSLFYNIFKAQAENGLQRRDNEPEAAYELRRAEGERTLASVEILLNQGDEILVGWTVSQAEKVAALEIVTTATPGSEYASYFNELKGARSRFSNLLNTQSPLSVSMSWKLDKPSRKSLRKMLAVAQKEMLGNLAKGDDTAADQDHPIRQLVQVLDATFVEGHADLIAQMVGTPPGPYSLVGGIKMNDSGTLTKALEDILGRLKGRPQFSDVRLNASTHKGINIHRLEPAQTGSGENRDRMFGGKPAIYLAVDDQVLWFAVGADNAPVELKRAIDRASEPAKDGTTIPFQLVMNFASWTEIFDPEQRTTGFAGLARKSFSKGGDSLRLEVLPITDGARFRIQFDEAFLRLAGSAIARQMDGGSN